MQNPKPIMAAQTAAPGTGTDEVYRPAPDFKKIDLEPEEEEVDETYMTLQRLLQTFNSTRQPTVVQSEEERRREEREAQRRELYDEANNEREADNTGNSRSAAERRIRSRVWSTTCSLPPSEMIIRDRWLSQDVDDSEDLYSILHPAIIRASFRPPTSHPKIEVIVTPDHEALLASLPRSQRAVSCGERMLKPPKSTWYLRGKNMEVQ
ncbi:unnamed protein product [Aphanomyces euteiches]